MKTKRMKTKTTKMRMTTRMPDSGAIGVNAL